MWIRPPPLNRPVVRTRSGAHRLLPQQCAIQYEYNGFKCIIATFKATLVVRPLSSSSSSQGSSASMARVRTNTYSSSETPTCVTALRRRSRRISQQMLALLSSSSHKDEHQEHLRIDQTGSQSWPSPSATTSRITLNTMGTMNNRTAFDRNNSGDIFDPYTRTDAQRDPRSMAYPPPQFPGHRTRLVHLPLRPCMTPYADAAAARQPATPGPHSLIEHWVVQTLARTSNAAHNVPDETDGSTGTKSASISPHHRRPQLATTTRHKYRCSTGPARRTQLFPCGEFSSLVLCCSLFQKPWPAGVGTADEQTVLAS